MATSRLFTNLDQIFILLRNWLVGFLPAALRPAAGVVLGVITIVCLFPGLFALTTVFERKGLGRIQNRLGPNRVGPFGFFQPIADGIKSLTKEDIVPFSANAVGAFSCAARAGGRGLHGLCRAAHGPQHGAGRHGRRPALLLRHGRVHRAFGLHGRLVEPQQIFAAGRHARRGADDQLRSGAAAFERFRGHDRRLALAAEDRRRAEPATPASFPTGTSLRPGDWPAS